MVETVETAETAAKVEMAAKVETAEMARTAETAEMATQTRKIAPWPTVWLASLPLSQLSLSETRNYFCIPPNTETHKQVFYFLRWICIYTSILSKIF